MRFIGDHSSDEDDHEANVPFTDPADCPDPFVLYDDPDKEEANAQRDASPELVASVVAAALFQAGGHPEADKPDAPDSQQDYTRTQPIGLSSLRHLETIEEVVTRCLQHPLAEDVAQSLRRIYRESERLQPLWTEIFTLYTTLKDGQYPPIPPGIRLAQAEIARELDNLLSWEETYGAAEKIAAAVASLENPRPDVAKIPPLPSPAYDSALRIFRLLREDRYRLIGMMASGDMEAWMILPMSRAIGAMKQDLREDHMELERVPRDGWVEDTTRESQMLGGWGSTLDAILQCLQSPKPVTAAEYVAPIGPDNPVSPLLTRLEGCHQILLSLSREHITAVSKLHELDPLFKTQCSRLEFDSLRLSEFMLQMRRYINPLDKSNGDVGPTLSDQIRFPLSLLDQTIRVFAAWAILVPYAIRTAKDGRIYHQSLTFEDLEPLLAGENRRKLTVALEATRHCLLALTSASNSALPSVMDLELLERWSGLLKAQILEEKKTAVMMDRASYTAQLNVMNRLRDMLATRREVAEGEIWEEPVPTAQQSASDDDRPNGKAATVPSYPMLSQHDMTESLPLPTVLVARSLDTLIAELETLQALVHTLEPDQDPRPNALFSSISTLGSLLGTIMDLIELDHQLFESCSVPAPVWDFRMIVSTRIHDLKVALQEHVRRSSKASPAEKIEMLQGSKFLRSGFHKDQRIFVKMLAEWRTTLTANAKSVERQLGSQDEMIQDVEEVPHQPPTGGRQIVAIDSVMTIEDVSLAMPFKSLTLNPILPESSTLNGSASAKLSLLQSSTAKDQEERAKDFQLIRKSSDGFDLPGFGAESVVDRWPRPPSPSASDVEPPPPYFRPPPLHDSDGASQAPTYDSLASVGMVAMAMNGPHSIWSGGDDETLDYRSVGGDDGPERPLSPEEQAEKTARLKRLIGILTAQMERLTPSVTPVKEPSVSEVSIITAVEDTSSSTLSEDSVMNVASSSTSPADEAFRSRSLKVDVPHLSFDDPLHGGLSMIDNEPWAQTAINYCLAVRRSCFLTKNDNLYPLLCRYLELYRHRMTGFLDLIRALRPLWVQSDLANLVLQGINLFMYRDDHVEYYPDDATIKVRLIHKSRQLGLSVKDSLNWVPGGMTGQWRIVRDESEAQLILYEPARLEATQTRVLQSLREVLYLADRAYAEWKQGYDNPGEHSEPPVSMDDEGAQAAMCLLIECEVSPCLKPWDIDTLHMVLRKYRQNALDLISVLQATSSMWQPLPSILAKLGHFLRVGDVIACLDRFDQLYPVIHTAVGAYRVVLQNDRTYVETADGEPRRVLEDEELAYLKLGLKAAAATQAMPPALEALEHMIASSKSVEVPG